MPRLSFETFISNLGHFPSRPAASARHRLIAPVNRRQGRAVDFHYSLYDALVSVNVPSDKARAVVDAMERDMATTLATRQDLQLTGKDLLLIRKDLDGLRTELKQDLALLRSEMDRRFAQFELTLTVRMAVLLAGYSGLMFAGLRLLEA